MGPVQVVAAIVAFAVSVAAVALFARAIRAMVKIVRIGQPVDAARVADRGRRTVTVLRETLGHTRMLKWTAIGAAHWFVMVAFGALLFTLVEAYGDTVNPRFKLPLIGGWAPYGLATEAIAFFAG